MSDELNNSALDAATQAAFRSLPLIRRKLILTASGHDESRLPMSSIQILMFLSEHDAMSISAISTRFGIAKPNITPIIDRLANAGYVVRASNPGDRRIVNIVLSPAGKKKVKALQTAQRKRVKEISDTTSAEDWKKLADMLNEVADFLESIGTPG